MTFHEYHDLVNQYNPFPRANSSTAGKDATRAAWAQIYAGLGNHGPTNSLVNFVSRKQIFASNFKS